MRRREKGRAGRGAALGLISAAVLVPTGAALWLAGKAWGERNAAEVRASSATALPPSEAQVPPDMQVLPDMQVPPDAPDMPPSPVDAQIPSDAPDASPAARKRRSAGGILGSALLCLICLALIGFTLIQVVFPEEGMRLFGFKTYLVSHTGSMEPMLTANDFIIVRSAAFDSIQVGSVITFEGVVELDGTRRAAPITHQVVEAFTDEQTGARAYRTAGINKQTNPLPDAHPVTADGTGDSNRFIGEYVFKIPVLGHVIAFIRSPFGLFAVAVNAIILILLVQVARGLQPDAAKREKRAKRR